MDERRSSGALRRHARLGACGLMAVLLGGALVAAGLPATKSVLLAFDIAVVTYLAAVVRLFSHARSGQMQQHARQEGESYWGVLLISVAVAAVALLALVVQLQASKSGGVLQIALAGTTQALVWLFIHTVFALHYAHEFYGAGAERHWGLEFPGTDEPDYWDFIYFSFCLGMTFQVSDVEITERGIRRVATVQAVVAFLFNVVILALSVNIVASVM
jgi:uncharacterized membrane protein